MIIKSVEIQNYRSIEEEKIDCEELTALVGANGSGKSSFIKALELFYTPTSSVDIEDFHNRNHTKPIIITLTFTKLSALAKERFSKYIQGDKLRVERSFYFEDEELKTEYYGSFLQNAEFNEIRKSLNIKDRGVTVKSVYQKIRETQKYNTLPTCSTIEQIKDAIETWELENP